MKCLEESFIASKALLEIIGNILNFLKDRQEGATISDIREFVEVNRKYCLVYVNYCDKEGFTIRQDDARFLGPMGKKFLQND